MKAKLYQGTEEVGTVEFKRLNAMIEELGEVLYLAKARLPLRTNGVELSCMMLDDMMHETDLYNAINATVHGERVSMDVPRIHRKPGSFWLTMVGKYDNQEYHTEELEV
jgi:hypothetical protein